MNVYSIKQIARRYVADLAAGRPDIRAAYFHGSVNQADDREMAATDSDVDVMMIAEPSSQWRTGKRIHDGVVIDLAVIAPDAFQSADEILGNYRLAAGFVNADIIFDRSHQLHSMQAEVQAQFYMPQQIQRRCEAALDNARHFFSSVREGVPSYTQVASCLFGNGAFAHVLLVAALKNPTIRKRYVAVRNLCAARGEMDFYEELLDCAGLAGFSQHDARRHLQSLEKIFEEAKRYVQSSYQFASDIGEAGRGIAIGGSKRLIDNGYHREAMFWIAVTHARCREVLERFSPVEVQQRHEPAWRQLLTELHLDSFEKRMAARHRSTEFIPALIEWQKGYLIDREADTAQHAPAEPGAILEADAETLERQEMLAYFWKAILVLLLMIVVATIVIKKI